MSFFKKFREKNTAIVQKTVASITAALSSIAGFCLLFIPFSYYYLSKENFVANITTPFSPISFFSIIKDNANLENQNLYLGFALFFVWWVYIVVVGILLVNLLLHFGGNEKKLIHRAKRLCIINTVATALYFLGGIICNFINIASGTPSVIADNKAPMVITLVIDLLLALYLALINNESSEKQVKSTPENQSKRRKLLLCRLELFLFSTCILVCSALCFFSKIIQVTFADKIIFDGRVSLSSLSFELTGIDILQKYDKLDGSGQILAFLLLVLLSVVAAFYLSSLIALISKSRSYFPLALGTVLSCCIGCFLIGMYSKYYEMLQDANFKLMFNMIEAGLPTALKELPILQIKELFEGTYTVESNSFIYLLITFACTGLLLARRPYSKGIALERELELSSLSHNANINGLRQSALTSAFGNSFANPYTKEGTAESLADLEDAFASPSDELSTISTDLSESTLPVGAALANGDIDPCPAFSEIDELSVHNAAELEQKMQLAFEDPTLPSLVQFIVQYARNSRRHLFYTEEDIAAFIAGLGASKLTILQGMSGTGKTSLPKIFCEALLSNCNIVEVESSWRDKNELLGYYNEFSRMYTPKKFTQALYYARLHPETLTFIVLDEMNLSRIEYYFSDFLSLMENEPDKREIKLLNVGLFKSIQGNKLAYRGLTRGHTIRIPSNIWFVGTANRDESTFEISDKVYDRAHTMNFNKRAKRATYFNEPIAPRFLPAAILNRLFEEAKAAHPFRIEQYPLIAEVEKLLEPYHISFGNRIALQIEDFVSIYCACFSKTEEIVHRAVERILLSKVVSKLELKSIESKEELAAAFDELGLHDCSDFIAGLDED